MPRFQIDMPSVQKYACTFYVDGTWIVKEGFVPLYNSTRFIPNASIERRFVERLGCSSNTCEPTKDLDPNWAVGMLDLHEATQFTILDTAATNLLETITSTT
jgi:hypothetical protein